MSFFIDEKCQDFSYDLD